MITKLKSKELTVQIKNAGAELISIINSEGLEFLWQGKKEIWPRHAPVLFPIVGKLRDDTFEYNGVQYKLPQHGFARDMEFILSEKSDVHCIYTLTSSEETLKKYPFEFAFSIVYRLKGNAVSCEYRVTNKGNSELYFSVGAHPGFTCPLLPHEKFEDYFLEFEESNYELTRLNNGLRETSTIPLKIENKRLPITSALFDNDALVFENRQINKLRLRSQKSSHQVEVQSDGWPYYGIWSKKGCREFICLEPWYGITDRIDATGQIAEKEGMISLQPKKSFDCSFSITLG